MLLERESSTVADSLKGAREPRAAREQSIPGHPLPRATCLRASVVRCTPAPRAAGSISARLSAPQQQRSAAAAAAEQKSAPTSGQKTTPSRTSEGETGGSS